MKLDTLKKIWQQDSSKYQQQKLSREQIRTALNKKTLTITEKIERNMRIAFIIVIAYIFFDVFFSIFFSSKFDVGIPNWIFAIGVGIETIIFVAFLYFVYQYYKVKRKCKGSCNLKDTLERNINILKLSEKIYYSVFFIFIGGVAVSFLSGVYKGIMYAFEMYGITAEYVTAKDLILPMGLGFLMGVVFCFLVYLLMRWMFRKLFGQYLTQLQATLKELKEIEH